MELHESLPQLLAQLDEGAFSSRLLAAMGHELIVTDATGAILYCGEQAASLLGCTAQEMTGKPVQAYTLDEEQLVSTAQSAQVSQLLLQTTQGAVVGAIYAVRERRDGGIGPTEAYNRAMEESNHRVRNNLAMICALLDMEMLQAPEPERHRLLVSLARTRSLALVHNLLHAASQRVEVGLLVRAVIDNARTLFARIDGTASVESTSEFYLSPRRATYLSLVLTELAVYLIQCAITHGTPAFPTVQITGSPTLFCIDIRGSACAVPHACAGLPALSKEIIVGLVERSLNGRFTCSSTAPFTAQIYCASDHPAAT